MATRTDRSDFLRAGNSRIPSSPKSTSLTRRATDVLAGTRNDTEYTAVVTQLYSAWDDQDLRDRGRGSKSLERAARFMLLKPIQNGMLNRLRTVSRVMQPS